jgi:hypothetical protein
MGSKIIRNVTKIMQATSGRLFGRVTSGTGRAEELTPTDVRSIISVYSTAEVDAIISGIDGLTSADIDTLAEINAILTDADLASVSYVDGLAANYATDAQGALADSALQPADIASGTITARADDIDLSGGSIGDVITVQADGSLALSTPAGGSPGGSSGQMQFNDGGSLGGTTAIVYASTGTHMVVTAQTATDIPLQVNGAASHTVSLQQWLRNGTVEAAMERDGSLTVRKVATEHDVIVGGSVVMGGSVTVLKRFGAIVSVENNLGQIDLAPNRTAQCTIDLDETAGNTRMLLYDVDSAALQRVSVGADDSGGTGFKVLRIPN